MNDFQMLDPGLPKGGLVSLWGSLQHRLEWLLTSSTTPGRYGTLEGLIQLAFLDAISVEVEALVERLVDVPANHVVPIGICRIGFGH
jgi:hypothetical protein